MTGKFLITTADERTWKKDAPILFLGDWCRLFSNSSSWKDLGGDIVPYHWDDRDLYYRDYHYLQKTYEKVLEATAKALNDFHREKRSLRYWRILIGPWLYLFTHTLFDRWMMVKKAGDCYEIEGTVILDLPIERMILQDLRSIEPDNIEWNHYLFGKAIQWQGVIPWTFMEAFSKPGPFFPPKKKRGLVSICHSKVSSFLGWFTKSDEFFVIQSYMSRLSEMKLQLALGQVPKLWKIPDLGFCEPSLQKRQRLKIKSDCDDGDDFYAFLESMIPEQIPIVYLEGYDNLQEVVKGLPWPDNPQAMLTSNLFQNCEVFQSWAADKVEKGSRLIIGQHGGFYGVSKWHCGEDHQVKVADCFLTWGWVDERPSVRRGFVFTNVDKKANVSKRDGNLLMVTTPVRLMGYKSICWPVGPNQSKSYFRDQTRFVEGLDRAIQKKTIIRIHKGQDRKMHAHFFDQLAQRFPEAVLDDSSRPIEEQIRKCRIFLYTYNSTGFLETLSRNIPTVIFWSPDNFELRPNAQPHFDSLEKAGIFHKSPESAASHINAVWEDVSDWWNRVEVQKVRQEFCKQYANVSSRPISELKAILKQ